jgi:putative heme-binding domain-containing protein
LLEHPHPRVREQGLALAERWLATDAAIQQQVLALAADDDPQVRFQVALSLGAWDDDRVLAPLAKIALAQIDDPWTRLAVQTAVPRRAGELLSMLLGENAELLGEITPDRLKFVSELAALVGGRQDPREAGDVLEAAFAVAGPRAAAWQMGVRRGLADGVARRSVTWSDFLGKLPPERQPLVAKLEALLEGMTKLARAGTGHSPDRLEAVGALAQVDWKNAEPVLRTILRDDVDEMVKLAAVRAAAAHSKPGVATLLAKSWAGLPVSSRRATLEALLSQPERTLVLLDELESGRIDAGDVEPARRLQLLNHRRSDVRERAGRIFAALSTPQRKDVLARYQAALHLDGDPRRGRQVFQKATCIACHHVGQLGVTVGPDISETRTKTPAALLVDILDPNAAIDANYFNYLVTLKDGRSLSGLLAAESATSITLRRADVQTDTILRNDIEDDGLFNTNKSLMPEGLEKNLTLKEMADLLAFLKCWRETE